MTIIDSPKWMLYGANGYTGRLTAALALHRGMTPILAGRNVVAVRDCAERAGLPCRIFGLRDPAKLDAALQGVSLVLNMAGPFSATTVPLVEACIRQRVHYLDITGEIDIFEWILSPRRDQAAKDAGVCLIPGVGFDVAPTDCLAAGLARELPEADSLELAFWIKGGVSPGTMKTSMEALPQGGRARIDRVITTVPLGWRSREVDFPHGRRHVVSISWGDVSTAFHSTGIPTVTTYMALPPSALEWLRRLEPLTVLARPRMVQSLLKGVSALVTRGPGADRRADGFADVWGRVSRLDGAEAQASVTTPEAYDLTADAALKAVKRVLGGHTAPGAATPSRAFGPGFLFDLDGVRRG